MLKTNCRPGNGFLRSLSGLPLLRSHHPFHLYMGFLLGHGWFMSSFKPLIQVVSSTLFITDCQMFLRSARFNKFHGLLNELLIWMSGVASYMPLRNRRATTVSIAAEYLSSLTQGHLYASLLGVKISSAIVPVQFIFGTSLLPIRLLVKGWFVGL